MQPRLHRAQRAANGRGNLFQPRTREETKLDDQAMLFRQARHRLADSSGIFRRLCHSVGRVRSGRYLAKAICCGNPGGVPASPSFQEPVPQNAVEPGGEPATTIKTPQGSPRFDQRLLRKILGPVAVPAKSQRAAPQPCGVPLGQPLEGNRLAGPGTVDPLAFLVFGRVHGTGDSPVAAERFTREDVFLWTFREPEGRHIRTVFVGT